ncbi:hypothetical protein [Chitinivorax sp. B]|uniref:hypothetical protein n=1 Tax=Chitinivorax sp. B TaxID=2502235 RepID=UPI0010F68C56|nr:hypothetical protein [Chitinivorax sp. B]
MNKSYLRILRQCVVSMLVWCVSQFAMAGAPSSSTCPGTFDASGNVLTTCYFDLTAAPSSTQTTPPNVMLNGGIFRVPDPDGTLGGMVVGTGVFDPFVRIQTSKGYAKCQPNCSEQGFNTDGRTSPPGNGTILDNHDKGDSNWNHSITLGQIPKITVCDGGGSTGTNCQQYYEFLLDMNEEGNENSGLSLDSFKLYVAGKGDILSNSVTDAGCAPDTSPNGTFKLCDGATEVYDMDNIPGGDASLLMDYTNFSGSGKGVDLQALVPVSNFAGYTADSFVYLYSKFGETGSKCTVAANKSSPCQTPNGALGSKAKSLTYGSDAGFEEWSIRRFSDVPIPSTALLIGLGMMLITRWRPTR